jgi:tRNA nucleotidyltransferase/poly(A) polymerase
MVVLIPEQQRQFALDVVRSLRAAGFVAYWAGGCVRDQLLGRRPKDYDVATDATPEKIRQLFGYRHTLALGAAFGVITVRGPKQAGLIEVATFRRDAAYSDGRHPDSVAFSEPREDALRRDFTINGLFYDPIDQRVIDYVGGREDLQRQVIRAIGDPSKRFDEDKLRLLRAVRFAAEYGFALDPATQAAVRQMAGQITVVSPERIAAEMRRILTGANRARGVRLLVETGLGAVVLPELAREENENHPRLQVTLTILQHLRSPGFPLALAGLLHLWSDAAGAEAIGRRWRLSNKEIERTAWLVANYAALDQADRLAWSAIQPILVAEGIDDLLAFTEARALADVSSLAQIAWCRQQLQRSRRDLNPPPLLTGDSLREHGLSPGPLFKTLLERVRQAQLDGLIHTRDEALALVDREVERNDGETV